MESPDQPDRQSAGGNPTDLIREAIENLSRACVFWHCKGPDAPFVSMSTCVVCGTVQDLRKVLAALEASAPADTETLAKITSWVNSDVVTANSGFGSGYRECQRDIRDLLAGETVVHS